MLTIIFHSFFSSLEEDDSPDEEDDDPPCDMDWPIFIAAFRQSSIAFLTFSLSPT